MVRVFVDSDVIISSLLSSSGAAYLLLNTTNLKFFVSNISIKELESVAERLDIDKRKLRMIIRNKFKTIQLKDDLQDIKKRFGIYTLDSNDSHIVTGARKAKVRFLVSYNIRHFKTDKIKQDFNIVIVTPGQLLQYLRSLQ